jgi:predicted ATPase
LRRFILTGAPGAGKTAIIRQLELDGFGVVEEAATDVIALHTAMGIGEPWMRPSFIDAVVGLQHQRQRRAAHATDEIQFHDRSAICTAALATYLGYAPSAALQCELRRLEVEAIYQRRIFFVRSLGFITPTEARRISLDEAMRFEAIHEETYRGLGYEIVSIAPGPVPVRAAEIERAVGATPPPRDRLSAPA